MPLDGPQNEAAKVPQAPAVTLEARATTSDSEMTAFSEKPKAETAVLVPGYELRVSKEVSLSDREKKVWEATLLGGRIIKSAVEGYSKKNTPLDDIQAMNQIFQDTVKPVLDFWKDIFTTLDNGQPVVSDDELDLRITELKGMINMDMLTDTSIHVLTMNSQAEQDSLTALRDIWIHDIKGRVVTPSVRLEMLKRKQDKGVVISDEQVEDTQTVASLGIGRIADILATGMPFTVDAKEGGLAPEDIFSHHPVGVTALETMIEQATKEAGVSLHIDTHLINQTIGDVAVDWNMEWAQRLIENVVSNAQKAHTDAAVDPEERAVDVYMGLDEGHLIVLFGDRGKGYPGDMLEKWADPAQRESIQSGWTRKDIPTTGLGLREHAGFLEGQYHGTIELFNWTPDGGAATRISIPLTNTPQ